MTIDRHRRGSMEGHSKMKENAKYIGIKKRMDQNTFEREIVKIKENFSKLMELLQRSKEDQFFGWVLRRKKIKWKTL